MKNDQEILNNVEILSKYHIDRFQHLLDNDRKDDAISIMQEYVSKGEVEDDDYQWLYVNYLFKN